MHTGHHAGGSRHRFSPRKAPVAVNFICMAPSAKQVALVGDFNHWRPDSHPMTRHVDGSWHIRALLTHGHHKYAFLVDGALTTDPRANGVSRNEKGERISLVAVS